MYLAVVQLAFPVMELVGHQPVNDDECSLGDIVLFGSKNRMVIDKDLSQINLDDRIKRFDKDFKEDGSLKESCLLRWLEDYLSDITKIDHKFYKSGEFMDQVKEFMDFADKLSKDIPCQLRRTVVSAKNSLLKLSSFSEESFRTTFKRPIRYGDLSSAERELSNERMGCITALNQLAKMNILKGRRNYKSFRDFCLREATLKFCTASKSFDLFKFDVWTDILVIDEAAYLKECESVIPLLLRGITHVFLIGDEKQLKSLVKNKVCLKE